MSLWIVFIGTNPWSCPILQVKHIKMVAGFWTTNEVVFISTSDRDRKSQVKWNQAAKLFMLHNEPKVIKQRPRDCVHTFIHLCNHNSMSHMKGRTHRRRSKEHLYCMPEVQPLHAHAHLFRGTCKDSTCTHEHTRCITPWAQAISHFTHYRPCSKETDRSSEQTLKAIFLWMHIISCIWPITQMRGQHWGRDGDRRKDWQAPIPASSCHYYSTL